MRRTRVIGIRTKSEYVSKPVEYRDNSPYWRARLLFPPTPTDFYKHNQHGLVSPIFHIVKTAIVDSPEEYLKEGVLHTQQAILVVGSMEDTNNE